MNEQQRVSRKESINFEIGFSKYLKYRQQTPGDNKIVNQSIEFEKLRD